MADTSHTEEKLNGGCLCGAIRFTVTPAKPEMVACHCSMCRRWSAGPFLSVGDCSDLTINDDASLGTYDSSDWGQRQFCSKCGTALFWMTRDGDHLAVSAQAFDDPSRFSLTEEIFIDEKPDHYAFANDTKKMTGAEVFALFAPDGNG